MQATIVVVAVVVSAVLKLFALIAAWVVNKVVTRSCI